MEEGGAALQNRREGRVRVQYTKCIITICIPAVNLPKLIFCENTCGGYKILGVQEEAE